MGFDLQLVFDRTAEFKGIARAQAGQIVAATARTIEGAAKQRAPVDTGALKNSIQAQQRAAFHWEVTVGVEYGPYVEYGTSRAPAQPFLTPAVEGARGPFADALGRLLDG
jgi:HK97 gp10 family phage protein